MDLLGLLLIALHHSPNDCFNFNNLVLALLPAAIGLFEDKDILFAVIPVEGFDHLIQRSATPGVTQSGKFFRIALTINDAMSVTLR